MSKRRNVLPVVALGIALLAATATAFAQGVKLEPRWWFGGALGLNFNMYSSDVRQLNAATLAPASFTKGSGVGLFLAPMIEYHPDPVWGGMLALAFDGRGGSFSDVNGEKLSATMNYLSLEPSLRIEPFDFNLYFFGGPRLGFNVAKSFTYTRAGGAAADGDWSDVRGTTVGGQIGAGYDIPLSAPSSEWQTRISPFISAPFWPGPARSAESWSLTTLRIGAELKFGNTKEVRTAAEHEVSFTVKAPRIIPNTRTVKETFPLRNYVFFDQGSDAIPDRYKQLSKEDATNFKEEQLLQPQPKDLTGRSLRQMTVYHNVLNVIGDRMRRNADATITLTGSSAQGPADGQRLAESIKHYLTDVFGIAGNRISTEGRTLPAIPSEQPGGARELDLVRPEDRRVDINSTTAQLLDPVQIISLQEEPLDSDVLFTVANAPDLFASWSVAITDETGHTKRYGPFTTEQERISGKQILGDQTSGTYTIALNGETKDGQTITREQTIKLIRSDEPEEAPGYRFSILFEFDQSKTVATYERFLTQTVAPLIGDGSSVIIHGHTDIIGEEGHNLKLSQDRARETMNVLSAALRAEGKNRVKFDTYGFGADPRRAPFDNKLPEERFYNRCVIIDIVPQQ